MYSSLSLRGKAHSHERSDRGHVDEGDTEDMERTPRDIREMESEAVALPWCV